jgi:hypothetical protein
MLNFHVMKGREDRSRDGGRIASRRAKARFPVGMGSLGGFRKAPSGSAGSAGAGKDRPLGRTLPNAATRARAAHAFCPRQLRTSCESSRGMGSVDGILNPLPLVPRRGCRAGLQTRPYDGATRARAIGNPHWAWSATAESRLPSPWPPRGAKNRPLTMAGPRGAYYIAAQRGPGRKV